MQSNNMISMTITTLQLDSLYDSHFFYAKVHRQKPLCAQSLKGP